MAVEGAIAEIAALQGGQIHREQLRALSLSAQSIDRRVRAGRLHRIQPSVFAVGHRRADIESLWHAAVLTCGDGAALCHRAAGGHLGIRPVQRGLIEVTAPRRLRERAGLRLIHRSLPRDEIVVHEGLPVTGSSRTLFDLAAILPERSWRRALKEVEARGPTAGPSLATLLDRHPRHPGAALMRAAIGEARGPANTAPSDTEEMFAELARSAGFARPIHRYGVALPDGWFEVDFAWPELRIAVECDSSFHTGRIAMETDRERDQALLAAGWVVFRVTWRQLAREPERVIRDLRAVISRRSAASSAGSSGRSG